MSFLENPKSAKLCFISCVIYPSSNYPEQYHKCNLGGSLFLSSVNQVVPGILQFVLRFGIGADSGDVQ